MGQETTIEREVVELYWCDTRFACGGIGVKNGKIVETPPIWRKWVGQDFGKFQRYYKARTFLVK